MPPGPSPAQAASISASTSIAARVANIPTCHPPLQKSGFGKTLKAFARQMEFAKSCPFR
jgi:hypothetical protein